MRAVIQRVSEARVTVNETAVGEIQTGLMMLLGYETEDTTDDITWLINKTINMRIFADEKGKMNLSLLDVGGDLMLISQFTLHASTKKGNRPSFIKAAPPELAMSLYEKTLELFAQVKGIGKIATGCFGEHMIVELTNNGPVTIFLDTKNKE